MIATIASPDYAKVDLGGKNFFVGGSATQALLRNNGGNFASGGGIRNGSVIVDYGGLAKGTGYYEDVVTQNGGVFSAGNCPEAGLVAHMIFGPGGVTEYVFFINDATGAAGPSPDEAGRVSGWGMTTSLGDFAWTATAENQLTVDLKTLLDPTTVGNDQPARWPISTRRTPTAGLSCNGPAHTPDQPTRLH